MNAPIPDISDLFARLRRVAESHAAHRFAPRIAELQRFLTHKKGKHHPARVAQLARDIEQLERAARVVRPAPSPVSPALLGLIDCCTPDNDGYRAPDAKRNHDDLPPIHIWPNASLAAYDPDADNQRSNERKRRKRERDTARAASAPTRPTPAHIREEVYELVRIHEPITEREARARMARCGYSDNLTSRALNALVAEGKITTGVLPARAGEHGRVVFVVVEVKK